MLALIKKGSDLGRNDPSWVTDQLCYSGVIVHAADSETPSIGCCIGDENGGMRMFLYDNVIQRCLRISVAKASNDWIGKLTFSCD